MKKKIIITIFIIILTGIGVGYILMPKEKNSIFGTAGEQAKTGQNEKKLTFIENLNTNYCDKGYYYINRTGKNCNIKYYDYLSKKEIYLCNKPNCNHDTETCSSYLDITDNADIFVYNNTLYIVSSTGEIEQMDSESDMVSLGVETQTAQKIYKMNLDGTGKTKVFEIPSGVEMNMPYIINKDTIYTYFSKSKSVKTGKNTSAQVETERKLVKININNGKYEEIADIKNKDIIGIYNNSLVLEETVYKQNPDDFLNDNNGYRNNLENSTIKIKLLDLKTIQETEIYQNTYKNMETVKFSGNCIYYMDKKSSKIEYLNVETKEQGTLIKLPKSGATIQGIYDEKLQYLYYNNSSNDAKVESCYYIDLNTKENKKFTLLDNQNCLMEIVAKNNEYYFIKTGNKMSKPYKTWAGTMQTDIEETYYGLIKKEDYWNSKAEYAKMKNTEK